MRLKKKGVLLAAAALYFLAGCSTTCKRISDDREKFLSRVPTTNDPDVEAVVPFSMANDVIAMHLKDIKPISVKVPGLGQVGSYLGDLKIKPKSVTMLEAAENHVGFALEFYVMDGNTNIFTMTLETEIKPSIDLEKRKIELAFNQESLKSVNPKLSKDAKKQLGNYLYEKIPKAARIFLPKKLVEEAAGTIVTTMVTSFYEMSKDKLLQKIDKIARIEFELPEFPLKDVKIESFEQTGGGLRLSMVSGLPVKKGLSSIPLEEVALADEQISVRISAYTVAELVNWAIEKGYLPDRFDKNGKPKKDGNFRAALEWVSGKKPMRIHLWQLEKPCMKITMEAEAEVELTEDKVKIVAKDAEIDDVEAHAFTKTGVWFYALWKDAVDIKKSTSSEMSFSVAGKKMTATLTKAAIEKDELSLGLAMKSE